MEGQTFDFAGETGGGAKEDNPDLVAAGPESVELTTAEVSTDMPESTAVKESHPPADTAGTIADAEQEKPPPFISSAFDFILNPDLEEADEEFSTSEDE